MTDFADDIVNEQVPEPEHAPLQLERRYPDAGAAVNVTDAVEEKFAVKEVQEVPQLIPDGELVTIPVEAPPDFEKLKV